MDYVIQTQFQGPGFVAVPNHVAQNAALSPEALGVLVYFASLPAGFVLRVSSVRERFNLGKDRWQRIARELRDVGAMEVEAVPSQGGRFTGKRVLVRWPDAETESRKTRPSVRKPENPAFGPKAGKPANQSRETRQPEPENPAPYKDNEQHLKRSVAKPAAKPRRLPLDSGGAADGPDHIKQQADHLNAFQRSAVLQGRACVVAGVLLRPGMTEFETLQAHLSAADRLARSRAFAAKRGVPDVRVSV